MKKVIATMILAGFVSIASFAQTAPAAQETKDKPKMSKEEKAKIKAKQEEEMNTLLKDVGLDEGQKTKVLAILAESKEKSGAIKKDASITEDDKKTQLKTINDDKNARLKEIMGEEKWKHFNELKKKQKEASPATP